MSLSNTSIPQRSAAPSQPHPLRLADLLDEIVAIIQCYITLPHGNLAVLIACWIANTYTYQHFPYCGYLALRSATPRCGKSRLLQLIGLLAKGTPTPITFPTPAVLFRRQQDVVLLDEVDALGNRDKKMHGDLLNILNVGFQRNGTVERMEKGGNGSFRLGTFSVYGPKALAGIESLADTLADRAFHVQMQRSPQRMERFNDRQLEDIFKQIRDGLEGWAATHGNQIESAYAALPLMLPNLVGLDDRFLDISEPLIILASMADKERPNEKAVLPRLYAGLRFAAGRREASGREQSLIAFLDIASRLLGSKDEVFVFSEALLQMCQKHPNLAYLEHTQGLAGLLKHFDLKPESNGTKRGYSITKRWLTDWQSRYCPRTDGFDDLDGKMSSREGLSPSFTVSSSLLSTTTPPLTSVPKGVSKSSKVSSREDKSERVEDVAVFGSEASLYEQDEEVLNAL